MTSKIVTSLALAAACLTASGAAPAARAAMSGNPPPQLVTNGPQPTPGDTLSERAARQNVRESRDYDRLLETSRAFREARMRKECGPINDPKLHAQCIASFGHAEPLVGSSTPPARYRYRSGEGR